MFFGNSSHNQSVPSVHSELVFLIGRPAMELIDGPEEPGVITLPSGVR